MRLVWALVTITKVPFVLTDAIGLGLFALLAIIIFAISWLDSRPMKEVRQ